jgi:hypothetical protein
LTFPSAGKYKRVTGLWLVSAGWRQS